MRSGILVSLCSLVCICCMNNLNQYQIDDLLPGEPFESKIRKMNGTPEEFTNYLDYFNFLRIIGLRLKENYRNYGEIMPLIHSAMENREEINEVLVQNIKNQETITTEIRLDQESFIIFSQILLNKTGMLIERLIGNRSEHNYTHSFTKHKNWFLSNRNISPTYSKILDRMHWYDQFLDVMRNKIIKHGGTLHPIIVTTKDGIRYRRKEGTFGILSERDRAKVKQLIEKYGEKIEIIKNIADNPYMMLDEFIERILENNIKLKKDDLNTLGTVVKNSGGLIDAIILSKLIGKFLTDVAGLF